MFIIVALNMSIASLLLIRFYYQEEYAMGLFSVFKEKNKDKPRVKTPQGLKLLNYFRIISHIILISSMTRGLFIYNGKIYYLLVIPIVFVIWFLVEQNKTIKEIELERNRVM